jgi:hypothetical protein
LAIARQAIPLYAGHGKALETILCGFHNESLASIACFLAGVLLMKGLGNYYGFNWMKRSGRSVEYAPQSREPMLVSQRIRETAALVELGLRGIGYSRNIS